MPPCPRVPAGKRECTHDEKELTTAKRSTSGRESTLNNGIALERATAHGMASCAPAVESLARPRAASDSRWRPASAARRASRVQPPLALALDARPRQVACYALRRGRRRAGPCWPWMSSAARPAFDACVRGPQSSALCVHPAINDAHRKVSEGWFRRGLAESSGCQSGLPSDDCIAR